MNSDLWPPPPISLQVSWRTMNTQQVWWCRWFEQRVASGYLDQLIRPSNACQWFWRISFTWWRFLDRKSLWSNDRTTNRSQSVFRHGQRKWGGGQVVWWAAAMMIMMKVRGQQVFVQQRRSWSSTLVFDLQKVFVSCLIFVFNLPEWNKII